MFSKHNLVGVALATVVSANFIAYEFNYELPARFEAIP